MKILLTTLLGICFSFSSQAQIWTMQASNFSVNASFPRDISVVDQNIAWTASTEAANVTFMKHQLWSRTTDGGATWISGTFTSDTNQYISNISAADENTCYILTVNVATGYGGNLYKTVDGGTNWNQMGTGQIFTLPASFGNVVHFWDADNGIVIGDPENGYYAIFKTSDGGATWTRVPQANIPNPLTQAEYGVIGMYGTIDDFIYFGTINGRIFRSHDRGQNWVASTMGLPSGSIAVNAVAFTDTLNGFAFKRNLNTNAYQYFNTVNGGNTWTQIQPAGPLFILDVQPVPGTNAIVSVCAGNLGSGSSISYDNGLSWTLLDTAGSGTSIGYTCVEFYDAITGWAGGISNGSADGIYKWNGGTVGLELQAKGTAFELYPNPTAGLINIEVDKLFEEQISLTLTDVSGRVLLVSQYPSRLQKMQIDLNNFPAGVYFVQVQSASNRLVKRVVKH